MTKKAYKQINKRLTATIKYLEEIENGWWLDDPLLNLEESLEILEKERNKEWKE